ncbi:MAG: c-type cytochrome [Betaproteobacteria bacterium]
MRRPRFWLSAVALLALTAQAQGQSRFARADIEQGREQFHRSCAQCHGRNMVNAGTSSYDLRRFPTDQPERFAQSVTQGKGTMPSFKDALSPAQVLALWAYVGSRGGKEP